MTKIPLFAFLLVAQSTALGQPKMPIYMTHIGNHQTGMRFESAFEKEISRSARYTLKTTDEHSQGPRFYIEFLTGDWADCESAAGESSVVSIVVETMGLPNSYPVPDKWYHKLIKVDRKDVPRTAALVLEDIDLSWCNNITNSGMACPKEKLSPVY